MIFAVAETLTSFFLLILLQDEMVPLNLWNNTQKPVNGFIDYYNRVLFKEQWRGEKVRRKIEQIASKRNIKKSEKCQAG